MKKKLPRHYLFKTANRKGKWVGIGEISFHDQHPLIPPGVKALYEEGLLEKKEEDGVTVYYPKPELIRRLIPSRK